MRQMNGCEIDDEVLKELVSIVLSVVSPEKIILFGSRARGDYRDDSDYDILVILDKLESSDKHDLIFKLNMSLLNNSDKIIDVDFLATSHSSYEKYKDRVICVYSNVEKDGVILYKK
jgi:predicted nucleotidyltransferase